MPSHNEHIEFDKRLGVPEGVARDVHERIDIEGTHDYGRVIIQGYWPISTWLGEALNYYCEFGSHGLRSWVSHHILDYLEYLRKKGQEVARRYYARAHDTWAYIHAHEWVKCVIANIKCDLYLLLGDCESAEKERIKAFSAYEMASISSRPPMWKVVRDSLEKIKEEVISVAKRVRKEKKIGGEEFMKFLKCLLIAFKDVEELIC